MKLPGVGSRTAMRFAMHTLRDRVTAREIISAISSAHQSTKTCARCGNISESTECNICRDHRRDPTVILVIAEVPDLLTVEDMHEFNGRYHVLGGLLDPLNEIGPDALGIASLIERLRADERIREVILALNNTIEGEHTVLNLYRRLSSNPALTGRIRVTRLARGLPMGSELAFADAVTLSHALQSREPLERDRTAS